MAIGTRLDIAEAVLTEVARIERDAQGEAHALAIALRFVVGAWLGDGCIQGFTALSLQDTASLRARGRDRLPNQRVTQARRKAS